MLFIESLSAHLQSTKSKPQNFMRDGLHLEMDYSYIFSGETTPTPTLSPGLDRQASLSSTCGCSGFFFVCISQRVWESGFINSSQFQLTQGQGVISYLLSQHGQ